MTLFRIDERVWVTPRRVHDHDTNGHGWLAGCMGCTTALQTWRVYAADARSGWPACIRAAHRLMCWSCATTAAACWCTVVRPASWEARSPAAPPGAPQAAGKRGSLSPARCHSSSQVAASSSSALASSRNAIYRVARCIWPAALGPCHAWGPPSPLQDPVPLHGNTVEHLAWWRYEMHINLPRVQSTPEKSFAEPERRGPLCSGLVTGRPASPQLMKAGLDICQVNTSIWSGASFLPTQRLA